MEEKSSNRTLEYTKLVLSKISFDPMLFRKELRKAMRSLMDPDRSKLKIWALKHYYVLAYPVVAAMS